MWFGMTVENLLAERVEVGNGKEKRYEAKYKLSDLLDLNFRVPQPTPEPKREQMLKGNPALLTMASQPGVVKRWRGVAPV